MGSLRLRDRGYGVKRPTVYKINGMWARVCPWCEDEIPHRRWEDAVRAAIRAWESHALTGYR